MANSHDSLKLINTENYWANEKKLNENTQKTTAETISHG